MEDMYDLSKFLATVQSQNTFHIDSVPTYAPCRKFVCSTLNELACETAKWSDSIAFLASYPIQKWADNARSELGINEIYITSMIHSDALTDNYFGLLHKENLENQRECLECTSQLIYLFDAYIRKRSESGKLLNAIHGLNSKMCPYSSYKIKKMYRQAVIDFCTENCDKINQCTSRIQKQQDSIEKDMQFVYHDADDLLKTIAKMKKSKKVYEQMELYSAVMTIAQCIMKIETYPFYPSLLSDILRLKMEDMTQSQIAKILNVSQEYVCRKYNEATGILSILIWGFSSMEVLEIINSKKGKTEKR